MARSPRDKIPQRRLVDLLRVEIDRSMRYGHATHSVRTLVKDNPNSTWSTHVAHNIGQRRFMWLWRELARDRAAPLPLRRDAASLASLAVWREVEQWLDGEEKKKPLTH